MERSLMNVQIDHRLRLSSFKQRALDTGQINGRKQTAGYRRKGWTNASRVTSLKSQPREIDFDDFENGLLDLQSKIVDETQDLDASERRFCHDRWDRPSRSGFGITRVMENGRIIEKGAVNISILRGILSPERAQSMSSRGRGIDPSGGQPYSAAALSLVFHPKHPFIPTLRADIRRFTVENQQWYGGGADLTPSYLFPEDFHEFHFLWKSVCDRYSPKLYPTFKKACDDYFYLPSRSEHRGIGGIFFDDLETIDSDFDVETFVQDVGNHFFPSWAPIVRRRAPLSFTYDAFLNSQLWSVGQRDEERRWQLLRRGRYIEFNLLYDRGIRFGLQGGRMESIMVSAPPLVSWSYNVQPQPGSKEADLLAVLQNPMDWSRDLS